MVNNKEEVIVVGGGFAGCVIARELAENNFDVTIIEERNVISGNMYDSYDENGILVQQYGPHIIFTDSIEVINYLKQFDELVEHDCIMKSNIDDKYIFLPFNYTSIKQLFGFEKGKKIIDALREKYVGIDRISVYTLMMDDDPIISSFAKELFAKAYAPYIKKQWNLEDYQIDKSVIDRVKFCLGYDYRYLNKDLQFLPKNGFYKMMQNMVSHPNIKIKFNTNALEHITIKNGCLLFDGKKIKIVYTGSIDELFGCKYGELPYRSLVFKTEYFDKNRELECEIVSMPQHEKYIRKTEYKYFNSIANKLNNHNKTVVVSETPVQYEKNKGLVKCYPIINGNNNSLYQKYYIESQKYDNLYLCGRLAEYKYYNMDAVILHSLDISRRIIKNQK